MASIKKAIKGGSATQRGRFPMKDLLPPSQTPGTFTDEQLKEMSEHLYHVGLTCEENTPEKMKEYVETVKSDIVNAATGNIKLFMAAIKDEAKHFDFQVDNTNVYFSKMNVIFANLVKIAIKGWYYIDVHQEEKTFSDTSVNAITDALSAIGVVISKIEGLFGATGSLDPQQTTSYIGDSINALEASESSDYKHVGESMLFAFALPEDGSTDSPAICGIKYRFELVVHNYQDKKASDHSTYYFVGQENLLFRNEEVFEALYQKVKD